VGCVPVALYLVVVVRLVGVGPMALRLAYSTAQPSLLCNAWLVVFVVKFWRFVPNQNCNCLSIFHCRCIPRTVLCCVVVDRSMVLVVPLRLIFLFSSSEILDDGWLLKRRYSAVLLQLRLHSLVMVGILLLVLAVWELAIVLPFCCRLSGFGA
jgi:hypothetical protein